MTSYPLLRVRDLGKDYRAATRPLWQRRRHITALAGVTFDLAAGETLGIIGESGSGKSTLARILCGLEHHDEGEVRIAGLPLAQLPRRRLRRQVQLIFQDPVGALNPRHTVRRVLEQPLRRLTDLDRRARAERLRRQLQSVGLDEDFLERYPHELSGGQAQRIGIARALLCEPALLILDEPTSALDVSVQAQLLGLLQRLRQESELAMIFIAHDLALVERISQRVMVLEQGRVVEQGPREQVFERPSHPYTRRLLDQARRRSAPLRGSR